MEIRAIPLVAVLLLAASSVSAQHADLITIVYDVPAREFSCWFAGPPPSIIPANPCTGISHTHSVTEGVYFFRGQTVRLLLKGAVAADLFALDLQVNDLVEPATPVFGGLTDLPRLAGLVPIPNVVTNGRATPAAGSVLDISAKIYAILDKVDDKSFLGYLKDNLLNPASSKDLQQILSVDFDKEMDALNKRVSPLKKEAERIQSSLKALSIRNDFDSLLDNLAKLKALLDEQRALREEIIASGIAAHGKVVSDALKSVRDPQFNILGSINTKALKEFISAFNGAFPEPRRFAIGNLKPDDKHRSYMMSGVPASKGFIDRLNKEVGSAGDTDAALKVLNANLLILADNWNEINIAVKRAEDYQKIAGVPFPDKPNSENKDELKQWEGSLGQYTATGDNVFDLQDALLNLTITSIEKAAEVNKKAREIALPEKYRTPVVGEWFGSKEIVLTVK